VYGVLLLLFSVGVYAFVANALDERADITLRAFGDAAEVSLQRETAEGESLQEAAISTVEELNVLPQQAISIFDRDGRLLARRGSFRLPFPGSSAATDANHPFIVRRPVIGDRQYVVVAGEDDSAIAEELEVLRRVLYVAVPMALAVTAIFAWVLVRKNLTPLAIMSEQAQRIGATTLDDRLIVPNPRDELGRLASSFNELLARLSAAFRQQRQFMADASHELRTPLSVIATAADVTLERERRPEGEYRDALAIVAQESRRLKQIVEDMFTLARADADQQVMHPAPLYLDDTLTEAVQAARVLAAQKRVTVHVDGAADASFVGDESLLRRLVMNLLDNAVRHSPADAAVEVTLERTPAEYVITVRDSGDGIPRDAQPHVFERFFQADAARSYAQTGAGAGLGLPIARWVAEVHGGSLTLERSDRTGSVFVVRLPLDPDSARTHSSAVQADDAGEMQINSR
jgi:heavy metal sensor kinase